MKRIFSFSYKNWLFLSLKYILWHLMYFAFDVKWLFSRTEIGSNNYLLFKLYNLYKKRMLVEYVFFTSKIFKIYLPTLIFIIFLTIFILIILTNNASAVIYFLFSFVSVDFFILLNEIQMKILTIKTLLKRVNLWRIRSYFEK